MRFRLPTFRDLAEAGRMLVGEPPYRLYLQHMERCHPGQPVMSEAEYFRNRQQARYGGGAGRCC